MNQWEKWWTPHNLIFVELKENLLLAGDQLLHITGRSITNGSFVTLIIFLIIFLVFPLLWWITTRFTWQDLTGDYFLLCDVLSLSDFRLRAYQVFLPPHWLCLLSSFCFFILLFRPLNGVMTQRLVWVFSSIHIHLLGNVIQPSGSNYLYTQLIPKFISFKFRVHISNHPGNIRDIQLDMQQTPQTYYAPHRNHDLQTSSNSLTKEGKTQKPKNKTCFSCNLLHPR